ncbi:hypothetical protein [Clostridium pasteurianum]|uniref:hypothetical protein n=1 Tax=Clostridium pasteurianum TaxID=1501 RepID=UPI0027E4EF23|nr:hypothetical protein [Clostridium pasteurianum]
MANKTNCTKNGIKYYKVYLELGRDSQGKRKRKEFYGKSKKEAEAKRDEYANGLKTGLNVDSRNVSIGKLMHMWLFEVVKSIKGYKSILI